ncbi:hypothetical protein Scep_016029 [Stephania cephalantha]|uniref:DEP domain-containing protein n=1 Tax=Stephania cephalantha TaxID=152367 RepID=A0AAP0ILU0_9MAGN
MTQILINSSVMAETETSPVPDHLQNQEPMQLGDQGDRPSDFSEVEIVEKREIYIRKDQDETDSHQNKLKSGPLMGGNGGGGGGDELLQPLPLLPQPQPPPSLLRKSLSSIGDDPPPRQRLDRSRSSSAFAFDVPAIGKFFRDRSNSFSSAIANHISSIRDTTTTTTNAANVTEFNLSGLKVTVQLKENEDGFDSDDESAKPPIRPNKTLAGLKGRVSFFSRSNCRDCRAVRSFFRERGLKFIEINIDVYPSREKELIQRTGGSNVVPMIFFNESLFGGLVALNSLRNCGELEGRLREMVGRKCTDAAPRAPVYGFDDDDEDGEEDRTDEMVGIVRVLRQRLPIQDRIAKLKIVKNCFLGSELVEALIQHLDCGRKKAVEIGKEIARRHFIHHVFGENDFEDGGHLYRFLEHESFIPKCFNFRLSTNDSEPKPAAVVSQKLTKLMFAMLESYASEDRRHVDYTGISNSEEFRRYVNLAQDLQRVNLLSLSGNEKLAFFINLYNAMIIHAVIRLGCPEGMIDRRNFFGEFQYVVGGQPYSLTAIKNGILRSNQRQPYSLSRPFGGGDKRLELAMLKVNPLIHFALCNGTRSSPRVQFFSSEGIEAELRCAARDFFREDGIEVDLDDRIVHLTRIIKWYNSDFGTEKETLKWIIQYLDASKAGLLTHLLNDRGPISIVYQDYDWSLNS